MQMSYHALEQINNRHISEAEVEAALSTGSRWNCPFDPEITYVRCDRMFVVTAGGDWVLTAYRLEN